MVRRVHIEILCTQCNRRGVEREGRTVQLVVDTAKMEVDLCGRCEEDVLQPLRGLSTTRGGKPALAAAPTPASASTPEEVLPCFMMDDYEAESTGALAAHMKIHHGAGFGGIVNRCPLCSSPFAKPSALGMHISRRHSLPGTGAALWEAHLKGDPHGVVQEARKRIETGIYLPSALSSGR